MEAYVLEWLNLLGRWAHFVVGIAWIGSSFYFIWLDDHLQGPAQTRDSEKGVGGELWSVHGGGFYHAQKYRVAPPALPETLHWFKWEAYSTWLTGMFLLALIYWYGAEVYLIDPRVAELSAPVAVLSSIGIIAGSWLLYDLLCRSPLGRNDNAVALILLPAVTLLAWGLTQLYSGRGAYIHFGVALGTIMVANVFFVIIPGQRKMVASAERGEAPDPADGLRAKQRSVHNTYFTLPVLFTMISNHYAMAYNHAYNWLILVGLSLAGALVRVWFVARHKGQASPLPIAAAAAILLAVAAAIAPRMQAGATAASGAGEAAEQVTLEDVHPIIQARCTNCHSSNPTFAAFPAPPSGVLLDTPEQIRTEATRIHQQTVVLKAMPIGNLTRMTNEERQLIDAWYRGLQ